MLFTTILLTCSLTFPLILFNKFAPAIKEDFVHDLKRLFGWFEKKEKIGLIARHKLLHAIQEILEGSYHANEDYQIPVPDPSIYNAMSIAWQNEYDPYSDTYFLENAER